MLSPTEPSIIAKLQLFDEERIIIIAIEHDKRSTMTVHFKAQLNSGDELSYCVDGITSVIEDKTGLKCKHEHRFRTEAKWSLLAPPSPPAGS